jgi:NAD(P)-dependent dehydrogenase (short-subunit alcohol dehydrogenase family)
VAIHCNWSVEEGETLALTIRESGGRAAVVQGELAEPEAAPRIVEAVNRALGTVDLLVNNASVFEADEATSVTLASWERHLAVNLRSPCFLPANSPRSFGGPGRLHRQHFGSAVCLSPRRSSSRTA